MSEKVYVKVSQDKAAILSDVRTSITNSLHAQMEKQLIPRNLPNLPNLPNGTRTIITSGAIQRELDLMHNNPNKKFYTYGFVNALLSHFFTIDKDYIVVPQSGETVGEVDFLVKKGGTTCAVVESKALKSNYSLTHLYSQAIQYAEHNHHIEDCYVIAFKGNFLSFGIYYPDFHSSNLDFFRKKYACFDGYLGLETDNQLNVRPMPQKDSVELQHRVYRLGNRDDYQNRSICEVFKYMAENQINLSSLN